MLEQVHLESLDYKFERLVGRSGRTNQEQKTYLSFIRHLTMNRKLVGPVDIADYNSPHVSRSFNLLRRFIDSRIDIIRKRSRNYSIYKDPPIISSLFAFLTKWAFSKKKESVMRKDEGWTWGSVVYGALIDMVKSESIPKVNLVLRALGIVEDSSVFPISMQSKYLHWIQQMSDVCDEDSIEEDKNKDHIYQHLFPINRYRMLISQIISKDLSPSCIEIVHQYVESIAFQIVGQRRQGLQVDFDLFFHKVMALYTHKCIDEDISYYDLIFRTLDFDNKGYLSVLRISSFCRVFYYKSTNKNWSHFNNKLVFYANFHKRNIIALTKNEDTTSMNYTPDNMILNDDDSKHEQLEADIDRNKEELDSIKTPRPAKNKPSLPSILPHIELSPKDFFSICRDMSILSKQELQSSMMGMDEDCKIDDECTYNIHRFSSTIRQPALDLIATCYESIVSEETSLVDEMNDVIKCMDEMAPKLEAGDKASCHDECLQFNIWYHILVHHYSILSSVL